MKKEKEKEKFSVEEELEEIRKRYKTSSGAETFNALIYGDMGTGKTNILRTCRAPILIHSFDPGGTKTLIDAIAEGDVIVDNRFEEEDAKKSTAFKLWEKEFDRLRNAGFFEEIGTYALDSATMWGEACMNAILKANARPASTPQLQDYLVQMNVMRDAIKIMTSLPCDFVMTGHIDTDKDEVTGKMTTGPMVTGKLKAKLPILFDEIYVTISKETSKGIEYSLLTRNTGLYKARSRLGRGGRFETYEKQDIGRLLKKAGYG